MKNSVQKEGGFSWGPIQGVARETAVLAQEAAFLTKESAREVLGKLTLYFAVYYLPAVFLLSFVFFAFWFPPDYEAGRTGLSLAMVLAGTAFAVFITPFHVFKFNERGGPFPAAGKAASGSSASGSSASGPAGQRSAGLRPPGLQSGDSFWDFVSENVTALVLAHIKVFFVLLLYFLPVLIYGAVYWTMGGLAGNFFAGAFPKILLILLFPPLLLPGLVKLVRLSFVTQAVFFENRLADGARSPALKASSQVTKGFFFPLAAILIFVSLAGTGLSWLCKQGLGAVFEEASAAWLIALNMLLTVAASFYIKNLILIFLTQLYFSLKKRQTGEAAP